MYISARVIREVFRDPNHTEFSKLVIDNMDPNQFNNSKKLGIVYDTVISKEGSTPDQVKYVIDKLQVNVNGYFNCSTLLGHLCYNASAWRKESRPRKEMVNMLLDLPGIDMYKGNRNGMDSLALYLTSTCEDNSIPDETGVSRDQAIINAFLEHNYDVNHQNKNGETAAMCLFKYETWWNTLTIKLKAIKTLLSLGADMTLTNNEGRDCLHYIHQFVKDPHSGGTDEERNELLSLCVKQLNGL